MWYDKIYKDGFYDGYYDYIEGWDYDDGYDPRFPIAPYADGYKAGWFAAKILG